MLAVKIRRDIQNIYSEFVVGAKHQIFLSCRAMNLGSLKTRLKIELLIDKPEGYMKLFCQLFVVLVLCGLLSTCDKKSKEIVVASSLPTFVTQNGNDFMISHDQTRLIIHADVAGRIGSLKINGQEMLIPANPNKSTVWGSVFWSSPQGEWAWPPIKVLDSDPYKISVVEDRIVFTSKIDPVTGYQFVKSYGLNTEKKCLSVIYSIYNHSATPKSVAGWEVTRLPPTGLVFFPQGNTESASGIFYPINVEHIGKVSWVSYDPKKIREYDHKLMTDGKEGWLAYVNNGQLLVKEFTDVPLELMVPGEGEIELFANAEKTFWEIDQQSIMSKLAPGEHFDWEVLWHTRTIPVEISAEEGSQALVDFVRNLVKGKNQISQEKPNKPSELMTR